MNGRETALPDFFPSTHWSMIGEVQQADEQAAAEALGRLLQRYQRPLTTYVTRKFLIDEDAAADLFQSFVAAVVLDKQLIHKTRRIEGRRFRSYLVTALHRFVVSEHRKGRANFRNPAGGLVSLDEMRGELGSAPVNSKSSPFDVAWARSVLDLALERMKAECSSNGRLTVWQLFEQRLLKPILHGDAPASYDSLVQQFGWSSPAEAQNFLVTAKRMFTRSLRSVVGEYVAESSNIETELAELQAILSNAAD